MITRHLVFHIRGWDGKVKDRFGPVANLRGCSNSQREMQITLVTVGKSERLANGKMLLLPVTRNFE